MKSKLIQAQVSVSRLTSSLFHPTPHHGMPLADSPVPTSPLLPRPPPCYCPALRSSPSRPIHACRHRPLRIEPSLQIEEEQQSSEENTRAATTTKATKCSDKILPPS
uniref:Candidate secreted effector n=1 Tax=Meloidogyne incognita TaxID=6306 RepID=A0A914LGC8_MELIC